MANNNYEPGCYFGCSRGIYIGAEIQLLAESNGWNPIGGIVTDPQHEDYLEVVAEAEDWLNDSVAVEGHYWGYNEHGDFGLWWLSWSMVTE